MCRLPRLGLGRPRHVVTRAAHGPPDACDIRSIRPGIGQPMLSPERAEGHNPRLQFRWYLSGVGAWFASFGIQAVIVTYLITTVLQLPPSWIGIAQGVMNLPAVLLLLVGGAVADHFDNRSVMITL